MKRLLITVLLVGMGCLAWAYDFSVAMQGYSLYFNVIDEEEKAVEVTSPLDVGNYRWMGILPPTGILNLPAEVEYEGTRYKVIGIAERAFAGCTDITGVNLPHTLTDIGSYAFYQCSNIRGVVTIGEEIISIGRAAFYGCAGITEVRFNAVACETMGGSRSTTAFGNCRSLKKITFGNQVRFIPDFAFVGMDLLQFEWNLPQSLEAIGEYAFAYCYSIFGTLRLPDGVKTVGPYAFAQCHLMFGIEIPSRIERIDQRAFYQCINVKQITVRAIEPPTIGTDVFSGIPLSAAMNVPCISEERYRETEGWGKGRNVKVMQPCVLDLYAYADDPTSGSVLGNGSYHVGDTATLYAVCHAGYAFRGWSDGNTDNPRHVVVVDTTSYRAIMTEIEVVHEVEYVHDTTYMDGIEVIYEYIEVNDVAEPISVQHTVTYDNKRHRIEVPIDKRDLIGVSVYNDAGLCVMTGKPRRGHINMRRFPSGYYIVRISTIDDEQFLRFFHNKNK